jgi:hypothetical protein
VLLAPAGARLHPEDGGGGVSMLRLISSEVLAENSPDRLVVRLRC